MSDEVTVVCEEEEDDTDNEQMMQKSWNVEQKGNEPKQEKEDHLI